MMNAIKKQHIKQTLLDNIRELERSVLSTKRALNERPGLDFAIDRIDGLLSSVETLKNYIPELNQHLDADNLDELMRVTTIVNELSIMIRKDATDIFLEISEGIKPSDDILIH